MWKAIPRQDLQKASFSENYLYPMFKYSDKPISIVLGNVVGPLGTTAEHVVRVQPGQKVAINHSRNFW